MCVSVVMCMCDMCVVVRYLFLGDDGNRMWYLCGAFCYSGRIYYIINEFIYIVY